MSAIIEYSGRIEDAGKLKEVMSQISQRGYQIDLISKPNYFAVKTTDTKDPREVENDLKDLENVRVVVACRELHQAESLLFRSSQH